MFFMHFGAQTQLVILQFNLLLLSLSQETLKVWQQVGAFHSILDVTLFILVQTPEGAGVVPGYNRGIRCIASGTSEETLLTEIHDHTRQTFKVATAATILSSVLTSKVG